MTDLTPGTIGYVVTHYPRVALTFIANEVDEVERSGLSVRLFSMNEVEPYQDAADYQRRRSATTYLKSAKGGLLAAFAALALRHPLRMARLKLVALRSAGLDLGLAARRLSHLLQAALVARECRTRGIRHLHAQFGQGPATVAWFATEMLNFGGPRASWSFTIHGFQDFVDEKVARLDLKARSASFVVGISDYTRSQLCRITTPDLWTKYHVIRCGIDLARFPLRSGEPKVDVPTIITVGRLSPEKGQLTLLLALAELRDRQVRARLVYVGAGPLEPLLRSEIDRLGLADRVELAGERLPSEVQQALAAADVFCLPSYSEGLPVSIMEAMAVGVPVVTSNIAGIPEIAVHEHTALTVPAGNSQALADALQRMLQDAGLRQRIVTAARGKVEEEYVLRKNVQRLIALHREHV